MCKIVIGISLKRCDQLKPDVVWDVLGKVLQSNSTLGLTERLEVQLYHVTMPSGNGRLKTKGRSLEVMSAIKRIISAVKAAFICMAHVLIICTALVNGNPMYKSYRNGYKLHHPVEDL